MSYNTGKIWGVFQSPGRRIRLSLQANNEVLYVNIKLTGTDTQHSVSLTLSELMRIPTRQIIKSIDPETWVIYNGHRKLCLKTYDDNVLFEVLKFKTSGWESQGEVKMTMEEFDKLSEHGPDILESASSRVLHQIA